MRAFTQRTSVRALMHFMLVITLLKLTACGDREVPSLPTSQPPSNATSIPTPTPTPVPTLSSTQSNLPQGDVPSTTTGSSSSTTSSAVGSTLEIAEDIGTFLDGIPHRTTATSSESGGAIILPTTSIRPPNVFGLLEQGFYVATENLGEADLNEPAEDICVPAPVSSGETCAFEDTFPLFQKILRSRSHSQMELVLTMSRLKM